LIQLQFVLGTDWTSNLIAWFGGANTGFSHVDVLLPDGRLLGSRSEQIGLIPPGVQIRPPNYARWRYTKVLSLATGPVRQAAFHGFLRQQLGKPYDKTAIVGFIVNRNWREDDSWYCSELITAALEAASIVPSLVSTPAKISPNALSLIASALGAK
jgi:hypothetical protein